MVEWARARSVKHNGTFYTGDVSSTKLRVFVHDDRRKTPLVWRWERELWIQEIGTHRARGLLTMVRARRQAPGFVIQTFDDPRDARVDWSAIRKTKDGWVANKPEHTKRASNVKMAAKRGYGGTAGNI
jgi:hypothetical protein